MCASFLHFFLFTIELLSRPFEIGVKVGRLQDTNLEKKIGASALFRKNLKAVRDLTSKDILHKGHELSKDVSFQYVHSVEVEVSLSLRKIPKFAPFNS